MVERGDLMLTNRVKALRKEKGITLEQLSEMTELSVSYLSRVENGTRGWTVESLSVIAAALKVTAAELIDASKAWQEVPIFGTVGELGTVTLKGVNGRYPGHSHKMVKVPAALGDVLALVVNGASMYPRYGEGDVLVVQEDPAEDISSCVGRECLVHIKGGQMIIKFVHPSALPNHFMLTTHNLPPIEREIESCRPILTVQRA